MASTASRYLAWILHGIWLEAGYVGNRMQGVLFSCVTKPRALIRREKCKGQRSLRKKLCDLFLLACPRTRGMRHKN
jgi:hypothetical protein